MQDNSQDKKVIESKSANEFCTVMHESSSSKTYHIYLCNEISGAHNYTEFFSTLRAAGSDDRVRIYINSPGGDLYTTIQIIAAIKRCASEVTCVLDGVALSAGAMIFLSGDDNEVNYGSILMAHWYSNVEVGKGQEIKSSVDFHDLQLKKMFREVYYKFLTDKELARLFTGEDFWFSAEEVITRLLIRNGQIQKIVEMAKDAKTSKKTKKTAKK